MDDQETEGESVSFPPWNVRVLVQLSESARVTFTTEELTELRTVLARSLGCAVSVGGLHLPADVSRRRLSPDVSLDALLSALPPGVHIAVGAAAGVVATKVLETIAGEITKAILRWRPLAKSHTHSTFIPIYGPDGKEISRIHVPEPPTSL
jgi:hypothetical protein